MLRFAGLLALPLLFSAASSAEGVPHFDISAICRAAPRLEASDQDTYQNCVRDETDARTQLERQWTGFDAGQRDRCTRETSVGGAPSYVDVLTCIQIASGNAPSAPPRRTPAKP